MRVLRASKIIYAILFPDAPHPKSLYVHIVLSEELCVLWDFITREWPRILSELVGSELPHVLQPQQDGVEAFVQTIFQDAVGTLLEQFEARNQETNARCKLLQCVELAEQLDCESSSRVSIYTRKRGR